MVELSQRRLWLPRHVFACLSGDYLVLLDVRRDQYLVLNAREYAPVADFVPGWPAPTRSPPESGESGSPSVGVEAADSLLNARLLTMNGADGKPAAPICIPKPSASLLMMPLGSEPAIRLRHVLAFVYAAILAFLELKYLRIERVFQRFTDRRRTRETSQQVVNMECAQRLLLIFRHLRPFAFRSHSACLLNSLALSRFLLHFGITCEWVFGVQASPFGAHCWLQHGAVVLNDSVENISAYTPIMKI